MYALTNHALKLLFDNLFEFRSPEILMKEKKLAVSFHSSSANQEAQKKF